MLFCFMFLFYVFLPSTPPPPPLLMPFLPRKQRVLNNQWEMIRGNMGRRTAQNFIRLEPTFVKGTQNVQFSQTALWSEYVVNHSFEIKPETESTFLIDA